jgi:hypothetical protein
MESEVVDDWAACRQEVDAEHVPIDTFKNYDEEYNSDSDQDEDVEFQDMQLFLHAIGEPQLVEHFLKNRVTLGQLLEFNEDDLINCGIECVGDRKKILANIGQMHSEKWQPSSLQELTSKSLLSSPGIYIALNDINKHIEYIGVTFKYFKRRLEEKPAILELGKDYVGVSKVFSEIEDLLKTSKTTYAQLKSLEKEVSKHLDDPVKRPANHIDEKYIAKARMRRRIAPALVVALAVCASIKLTVFLLRK